MKFNINLINNKSSKKNFIILGLMFIIIATFVSKRILVNIDNKVTTTGYLVDYTENYREYEDKYGVKKSEISWGGVYEFKVGEDIYTTDSKVYANPKSLVKEKVTIDYDKTNPNINIISSDEKFFKFYIGAMGLIGVSLTTIGVIDLIKNKKNKNVDYD